MIDLYAFRGYYSSNVLALFSDKSDSIGVADFDYKITPLGNDFFKFKIKNKSLLPAYVLTYRYDQLLYQLDDTKAIQLGLRSKILSPERLGDASYGFDCGTGLGMVSINPYENFEDTISYEQLLQSYNLINQLSTVIKDTVFDPFHHQVLFYWDENKTMIWNQDMERLNTDSIELQFFLPTHSITDGKQLNAYSNVLKISYIDIVKYNKQRYE